MQGLFKLAGMTALAAGVAFATTLPPVKQQGMISYLSGGIGQDEVDAMRAIVKDYNLIMQFAVKGSGEFVADVDVKVVDAKGRVALETRSEGPCLYAKVPPGQYKVEAKFADTTSTKSVNASAKQRRELYFYFPQAKGDESLQRDPSERADRTATRHTDCT